MLTESHLANPTDCTQPFDRRRPYRREVAESAVAEDDEGGHVASCSRVATPGTQHFEEVSVDCEPFVRAVADRRAARLQQPHLRFAAQDRARRRPQAERRPWMSFLHQRTARHELGDPAAHLIAAMLTEQTERRQRVMLPLADTRRALAAQHAGDL